MEVQGWGVPGRGCRAGVQGRGEVEATAVVLASSPIGLSEACVCAAGAYPYLNGRPHRSPDHTSMSQVEGQMDMVGRLDGRPMKSPVETPTPTDSTVPSRLS